MKYRIVQGTLAVLIAMAGSIGFQSRAFAQGASVQHFQGVTQVINDCTGANVQIVLNAEVVLITTPKSDGTLDIKELDHVYGSGVDTTSGDQYRFHEQDTTNTSLGPNPDGTPFSLTETRRETLIGLGGAPDEHATFLLQIALDGNGNITVDMQDFNLTCRP